MHTRLLISMLAQVVYQIGTHTRLLTVGRFAKLFSISEPTVRRLIQAGKIRSVTHPDTECVRIPVGEIGRFLAQWKPTGGKAIRPPRQRREVE